MLAHPCKVSFVLLLAVRPIASVASPTITIRALRRRRRTLSQAGFDGDSKPGFLLVEGNRSTHATKRRNTPKSCWIAVPGRSSTRGRPIAHVARDLGVHHETLRKSVRKTEADEGKRKELLSSEEREELARLRKDNRELRRANEILKAASAFFAAELDPHRPK
jgi:transposase